MGEGIGSHQSHAAFKAEWLTPPYILKDLGPFDLDPCAPVKRPWDMAKQHYTIFDDGLTLPWQGRVWCNPPYGPRTNRWLSRMAAHRHGTVLMFARTETEMFFKYVWNQADALLFIEGRLHFHHVNGTRARANAGGPSVLVAYGDYDMQRLVESNIDGHLVIIENQGGDVETRANAVCEMPI